MAKKPPQDLVEIEVTMVQKVGHEHFDVVVGVVRGVFEPVKVLDKNVTINVARTTAWKSMDAKNDAAKARVCLPEKA